MPEHPEPAPSSDGGVPAHRYTAALAGQIEVAWQDRWEREGTFHAANPTGPLADGFDRVADRPKLYVLDMFPYPSGAGLHVGHPLGYIGTDVFARYHRMAGRNVLHTLGYDAFGLPAEQYAVQTGTHPRITTEANIAIIAKQLRRIGLAHDPRRAVSTIDPAFYRWTQWIFLQIFGSWYDRDAGPGPADRRAGGRARRRRPASRPRARTRRGTPWADLDPVGPPQGGRRPPPRLPGGGAGELVPGPGHRAGQRGGHRRRAIRARQLPGVPAPDEAVGDADHRLRRPADRRPRPARLAGVDQADAAQLDRPQRGRRGALLHRGRSDHGVHHPARHALRRHLHGAGARAPDGRRAPGRRVAGRHRPALDRRRRHRRRRPSRPTAPRRRARASSTARPPSARRPACSSAPPPPTR